MGRAKSQDDTRRKIVEATMKLHEELGPRATTISAIAEKAGVQRLTVYRHFPDDKALLHACTSHWLTLNPPPSAASWDAIEDPIERLTVALRAFYRYYSATRRMWLASFRDEADVPGLRTPMRNFSRYVDTIAGDLATALSRMSRFARPIEATIKHALTFPTWADLDAQGLETEEMVALVVRWMAGVRSD